MKKGLLQLFISIFQGFSQHIRKIPLMEKLQEIASGIHEKNVSKIRALLRQGKDKEADQVKKQLSGFTLSATYKDKRLPQSIDSYTDMLMLDFDKMNQEILQQSRKLISKNPNTLFCFISPSGNGLKIGVYMRDESSLRLRNELLKRTEITYEELDRYHKQMFAFAKTYYQLSKPL